MAKTRLDVERVAARIRSARQRLRWVSERVKAEGAAMQERRVRIPAGAQREPAPDEADTPDPERTH